ncbi:MAG: hypothetical protein WCC47_15175 [Pseudonocardiaceae bacterium]
MWPGSQGRIRGFRRAAEILAHSMLSAADYRDMDTVVFPYLNCWRHYVELQLKCLIGRCQRLLDQQIEPKHGHRLDTLWADLGGLLDVTYPHKEPLDRSVVDRLLTQLAELDPDNQEFRYAERRNGAPTMADVRHLDIDKVHTAMLGLANYLEAIESAIDHEEDIKQEAFEYEWEQRQQIEQEMRDDVGYE